jgi:hypothetical protein
MTRRNWFPEWSRENLEVVVAYLDLLYRILSGGTEENKTVGAMAETYRGMKVG